MKRLSLPWLLVLGLMSAPASAQNAAAGATSYKQRCQSCHSLAPGQKSPMGPNLAGVFGRKAGLADFRYSEAMKKSGLTWDAATLERYLAAPAKAVPGGKMVISVPDAKQRADIIAFLQTAGK